MNAIHASVIQCPGKWEDDVYSALEITVDGVRSPFHMVMALSKVSAKAMAEQVDVDELYQALADGINFAAVKVEVTQ